MSEITCEVVEIKYLTDLENSDRLELTHVYSYPCIVQKGLHQVGNKVIYFPVDAKLPDKPIFSFVWRDKENPSAKERTIRAMRLRGTFSMGVILPFDEVMAAYPDLNPEEWDVGHNIAAALGVEKYEPPEPMSTGGDNERHPGWLPHYTDIENLRKYHPVLQEGEEIILTEKIHGANARYVFHEDRFWIGSHHNVKKLDAESIWNFAADKLNLAERLEKYPGLVFFGEVYGQVQKGFHYDQEEGKSSFILFDIYDISKGRYLDYDAYMAIAEDIGLRTVPVLYRGPWEGFTETVENLADGNSTLADHVREGFVLRLAKERFDDKLGRVIVKLPGQDYLTGKKKKKKK